MIFFRMLKDLFKSTIITASLVEKSGEHLKKLNASKKYKYLSVEELFNLHKETISITLDIIKKKNHDYTGSSNDFFKNFRGCERRGIPAEMGILIRCDEKLERIETFIKTGILKVDNESVDDAIHDVINYMFLLKGLITERRNNDLNFRKK